MSIEMPWSRKTPQRQGRDTEAAVIKKAGGRVHPMSGAGRIKNDGTVGDESWEVKQAERSFTLSAKLVRDVWTNAVRAHKDPVILVVFPGFRVRMTIERT